MVGDTAITPSANTFSQDGGIAVSSTEVTFTENGIYFISLNLRFTDTAEERVVKGKIKLNVNGGGYNTVAECADALANTGDGSSFACCVATTYVGKINAVDTIQFEISSLTGQTANMDGEPFSIACIFRIS